MSTSPKNQKAPQADPATADADSRPMVAGDAELSQILGDVEALQKEIELARTSSSGAAPVAAEENFLSELGGSASEGSLEETLGGMEIEESVGGILAEATPAEVPDVDSAPSVAAKVHAPVSPVVEAAVVSSHVGAGEVEDPLMDETLKTINDEIGRLTGEPSPAATVYDHGPAMSHSAEAPEGSLKLTLRGQMSLQLEFESSGQGVFVATEGDKLIVRLSNGAEFRIPLDAAPARLRRVA